jgi:tetratricopeptide (TPR) repeat protein
VFAVRIGRIEFAAHRFESILAQCPEHIGALYYMGWVMTDLGRFEESVAHYQRLLQRAPHSGAGHLGLANALQRLGRHEEAIDAFNAAIDTEPSNTLIQYNLAESLLACGRTQDALVVYRRVVRLEPEDAHAVGNLGATLGRLGHWEEALECDQRAMALNPSPVHARNLAVTLWELGRFPEAERACRQALELEPDSSELRVRLAMAMGKQGKHQQAIDLLTEVTTREPHNPVALSSLIAVLTLSGRTDAAVETARDFVQRHQDLALAHETLGWAYFKQGNADGALHCYESAIRLDPGNAELHAGRGAALSLAGRHREAIESFNVAVAAVPGYLDRYQELAECFAVSRKALSGE